jgi:lipopolysaccharide transport system ATP-binding protein
MTPNAIEARSLSKEYKIGELHAAYDTLREHIMRLAHRGFRAEHHDRIWAVQDISFDVEPGEVLGIIGRNGAGKTTLLRLLSRITEPTRGYADVRGRVGSLLEVGTGFHPELTGRDNIFLNGAILGMRRTEIKRKFDDIVEFAGVSKFLDTPVKRYSSGMYVRLAFAVAAHLEPEILLVDEVLAVGDADFQKRCLGKMESLGQSGRTVIFVSHSMPAIARLCSRLLLLDGGRLVLDGPTEDVISKYLAGEHGTSSHREWPDARTAPGNSNSRLRSVRVVDSALETVGTVDVADAPGIEIEIEVEHPEQAFVPWIDLYKDDGTLIFSALDTDPGWRELRAPGRYTTTAWIPDHLLNEGTIIVSVSLKTFVSGRKPIRHADADSVLSFHVVDRAEGESSRGHFPGQIAGPVRPLLRWTTEPTGAAGGAGIVASRAVR